MIPVTKIHDDLYGFWLLENRQRIVRNVQVDMTRNAADHKRMLADGVDPVKVAQFSADCAANYEKLLALSDAAAIDPVTGPLIADAMAVLGWTEKDFSDVGNALKAAVIDLKASPDVLSGADAVLEEVTQPAPIADKVNLWDAVK